MARGVNKVILIGNLGRDPEIRYTPNGDAIATVSLATSEQWKDRQTGEQQERTEWHRVVFFGRIAEVLGEYTNKGSKIYVEGQLRTRKWQDKEGTDRYTTEIRGRDLQLLDGSQHGGGNRSSSTTQPRQDEPSQQGAPPDDFDDDIPFMPLHGLYGG